MKNLYIFIFTILTVNVYGQKCRKNMNSEMKRLKIETVLIVQSQAIDEYPIWSPKSDYVACNIEGNWYKFRLTKIKLTDAKWHDQTIGVLTTKDAYSKMSALEKSEFEKVSKFNEREVTTNIGTKIELNMEELTVSLIVTKKGENPKKLWTSEGENCYGLVLSPDEKYVAYLCEMNGLLIMKLE